MEFVSSPLPKQTRTKKKEAKEESARAICNHALQDPSSEMPMLKEDSPKVIEKIAPLKTIEPAGINAVAED